MNDEHRALSEDLAFAPARSHEVGGAAQDFGQIKNALLSKGKGIGPYDTLIAAHARHFGATVVTNNEREFRRVPRLAVENWLK